MFCLLAFARPSGLNAQVDYTSWRGQRFTICRDGPAMGALLLEVMDSTGVPVRDAFVSLPDLRCGAVTDSSGIGRVAYVPPGQHAVQVSVGRDSLATMTIRAVAGVIVRAHIVASHPPLLPAWPSDRAPLPPYIEGFSADAAEDPATDSGWAGCYRLTWRPQADWSFSELRLTLQRPASHLHPSPLSRGHGWNSPQLSLHGALRAWEARGDSLLVSENAVFAGWVLVAKRTPGGFAGYLDTYSDNLAATPSYQWAIVARGEPCSSQ